MSVLNPSMKGSPTPIRWGRAALHAIGLTAFSRPIYLLSFSWHFSSNQVSVPSAGKNGSKRGGSVTSVGDSRSHICMVLLLMLPHNGGAAQAELTTGPNIL